MTNMNITELQDQLNKLKNDFNLLSQQFYKNNFSGSQVFTKDAIFNTRLKVPHYSTPPSISEVGDIIEVGGKLYICTVANTTWEMVGTQS